MTIMTDYAIFYGTYDNPGERFFLMPPIWFEVGSRIFCNRLERYWFSSPCRKILGSLMWWTNHLDPRWGVGCWCGFRCIIKQSLNINSHQSCHQWSLIIPSLHYGGAGRPWLLIDHAFQHPSHYSFHLTLYHLFLTSFGARLGGSIAVCLLPSRSTTIAHLNPITDRIPSSAMAKNAPKPNPPTTTFGSNARKDLDDHGLHGKDRKVAKKYHQRIIKNDMKTIPHAHTAEVV